jgi:hypothetical protein
MRKIDKKKILAKEYKEWVDKLNRDKVVHPQKNNTYYYDVLMNLLYCQKGVCAYTEMFLCSDHLLDENNWENGRYKFNKPECLGELDHFDHKLKQDKHWEWDNLFVVLEKVNRRKGTKEVDDILKPDSPGYDPMVFLEYNEKYDTFIPHTGIRDEGTKERIQRMIEVLQLNFDPVRRERRRFLKEVFKSQNMDEPIKIDRFFTAYQMAAAEKKENV